MAEAFGDVRLLIQGVDHLRQCLDAFFTGHFPGGQFHGLHGGEFFRSGQPGENHRHRCGVIQVGILVQMFAGQGCLRLAADGIGGQVFLQLVVGVVGYITDAAAVHDGRLFFFRQKTVEFGVVAGGDDQGVNRPLIAVDFNAAVLNDTQVHLDQILFVFYKSRR